MKRQKKEMDQYICPNCKTRVEAAKNTRLRSMYCENCRRAKKLTMLRRIQPKPAVQNTQAASEETSESPLGSGEKEFPEKEFA